MLGRHRSPTRRLPDGRRSGGTALRVHEAVAANERARLLHAFDRTALGLLPELDELAHLAREIGEGSSAFVQLVTADHALVRGRSDGGPVADVPAAAAIRPYTVARARVLSIGDTLADELTQRNPASLAGVRAYLGAPLLAGEAAVGTVCVIDRVVRAWTPEQADRLVALAGTATELLSQSGVLLPA